MKFSSMNLAAIAAHLALAQQGDLPEVSKQFPPGKDSNSPVINIAIPKGPYTVQVESSPAFQPNRTIYLPVGVPASVSVPIFSWGNGMCAAVGQMYKDFLTEIASHGYLVIAHGSINQKYNTKGGNPSYPASWLVESVDMAARWKDSPIKLDLANVALGGHSCGAGQAAANIAKDGGKRFKTGLVLNSQSANANDMAKSKVPLLFINGGQPDNPLAADQKYATVLKENPTLPIYKAVLETGHLGSYWSPRGGIHAETVVRWLDWHLKGNETAHAWFVGDDKSPGALRGWKVQSRNIK
jgi:hypothetical protein